MVNMLCQEQPKEWDHFLPAALFAYREIPDQSLGFSPFELLFGHSVRGPMHILKQLWTSEDAEPEVRTTTQYVVDLKSKIQETCALAKRNLEKVTSTQSVYSKKNAVKREFIAGDKVLLLLPMKNNKLKLAWQGPYQVSEKVGPHKYRVRCDNRYRVYHVNLLRKHAVCQDRVLP